MFFVESARTDLTISPECGIMKISIVCLCVRKADICGYPAYMPDIQSVFSSTEKCPEREKALVLHFEREVND
jgi:hypothetical protein